MILKMFFINLIDTFVPSMKSHKWTDVRLEVSKYFDVSSATIINQPPDIIAPREFVLKCFDDSAVNREIFGYFEKIVWSELNGVSLPDLFDMNARVNLSNIGRTRSTATCEYRMGATIDAETFRACQGNS